jgi:hypothetical protein
MRSSQVVSASVKIAIVLGSIQASFDTVESEGRQMKQCLNKVLILYRLHSSSMYKMLTPIQQQMLYLFLFKMLTPCYMYVSVDIINRNIHYQLDNLL